MQRSICASVRKILWISCGKVDQFCGKDVNKSAGLISIIWCYRPSSKGLRAVKKKFEFVHKLTNSGLTCGKLVDNSYQDVDVLLTSPDPLTNEQAGQSAR